ncbi:MAG: bifunctional ADP-dependent NAD(P)H-hydrate dehydratase/NAD(P)H-hydrate epimerase [Acidobacteria bacterium]|nr:MAG: bifunctional ADP-dependent NAD(P)H-hydrate dehydratase/NAD(P)H-hydrate epimerase [Acidobacteriota bacterium]
MRVLNSAQMREADRRTIEEIGISSLVLMENAGRQVVAAMEAMYTDLSDREVAVLCGRGNNGGDGLVVARTLLQRGVDVSVFLIGTVSDVRGDARTNLEILSRLGLTAVEIADSQAWELHFSEVTDCTLIVDAIFGTGLNAPLSGLIESVVADVNASGIPVVAIDLPSGLSADSAEPIGDSIEAAMTVTLAAPKLPLVLPPAETRAGDIVIADIGIPADILDTVEGPRVELLTRAGMRELISPRAPDSHKGDYGRVLIVAGSRGKTGAAHLAATGALRSGAGLVTIATPASCQAVVAAMGAEYMTEALAEVDDSRDAGKNAGLDPANVDRATMPLVIDADGLNAFSDDPEKLAGREGREVIITPHSGEMGRLVGMSADEVQASRLEIARNFATAHHLYVVLKGHRTLIATPDEKVFINPTGNPGMATGGTGDVLTGMIAAWLAQLLDAEAACKLAVYLHGMAGDLAEADEGEVAMTSADVAGHLGDAILELTARRRVVEKN